MIRLAWTFAVALAIAFAGGIAHAQPAPPPCNYTLTPPQVVQVSGTSMVTATVAPAACNQSIPYLSVACLQLQGSDGPGQCAQNNGLLAAQVFYAPYQPGATYVSTGRGCANTGNPPLGVCQPLGPVTATL